MSRSTFRLLCAVLIAALCLAAGTAIVAAVPFDGAHGAAPGTGRTPLGAPAGPRPDDPVPGVEAPADLGSLDPAADAHDYIVVLSNPPIAQYRGGIAGYKPTAVRPGQPVHLDWDSPAARAYGGYLDARRAVAMAAVRAVAPEAVVGWQWRIVLNGFSVTIHPDSAARIRALPGVTVVHPAETLEPEMDSTPGLIDLQSAWTAGGGDAEAGLGARIGTLEGGVVQHPWFRDEGMPDPPAGFPRSQLIGRNQTLDYPDPSLFTNRKLIGAYLIVPEAATETLTSTTTTPSLCQPAGCSSHGEHVMGTATGRWGDYEFSIGGQTLTRRMGGIAPMAQFLTYQNYDGTPGMVTGIEQMVKDGIDVFNASLGQSLWLIASPEKHPISLAIDAASDAGTLAVVSSGNAGGNGPTALSGAWKYSERLLAVGSSQPPGLNSRRAGVEGEGVPEGAREFAFGTFYYAANTPAITQTVTGELYFADDGCTVQPAAAGKVAFLKRFNADGTAYGSCDFNARRNNMAESGAMAVVFYYESDLYRGDSATIAPMTAAVGFDGGYELHQWLKAGGQGTITLDPTMRRTYDAIVDNLASSSSQGPGLGMALKPDITAPGDGIMSSIATGNEQNRRYIVGEMGGTSMAAPHVTGAAALIRSIHPNWTTDQVRGTLINTSQPSLRVLDNGLRPATPGEGGPGRLHLTDVADPGAFLTPPKLSFGAVPEGSAATITVTIASASPVTETWRLSLESALGDATVTVSPTQIALPPGDTSTYAVTFDSRGSTGTDHWGRVAVRRGASGPMLRQTWYAYVDRPADRRDVLLVNWTYGATPDHASVYTSTLEALGLTYSVWHMGDAADGAEIRAEHPTYREMFRHDLVIVNMNESPISLQAALAGQFQYQNHMLGGGSMLMAGQGTLNWWRYLDWSTRLADTPANRQNYPDTWPRRWLGPTQNGGCEMCLARYFAGFTPEITATLSGKLLLPFPTAPDRPDREVVLPPHPDADGPFTYPIDLSTGAEAAPGSLGNQYTFASGSVISAYKPTTSTQVTVGQGDYNATEGALDGAIPLARPLWRYTGEFVNADGAKEAMTKTVGTYVAGQQHPDAGVPWNAMFWGFGLEGVGQGAPSSASQAELLGDTFNFVAHNLYGVQVRVASDSMQDAAVGLVLPAYADIPLVSGAEIEWGDGSPVEIVNLPGLLAADKVEFRHTYAEEKTYTVTIRVVRAVHAAPFAATGQITVRYVPPTIYLPVAVDRAPLVPTSEVNPVAGDPDTDRPRRQLRRAE